MGNSRIQHVVMYSGGLRSWAAAYRVCQKYDPATVLLFTDTKHPDDQHPHRGEDQDLYIFLEAGAQVLGAKLEKISAGQHIWQVFNEKKYMGNGRVDPCSRVLKRETSKQYIKANFAAEDITLYAGIGIEEIHRCEPMQRNWAPYSMQFPLCEKPYLTSEEIQQVVRDNGLAIPRLYAMGFSHNNCGGFCVKAGITQFANLLKKFPERYAYHEQQQEELYPEETSIAGEKEETYGNSDASIKHHFSEL